MAKLTVYRGDTWRFEFGPVKRNGSLVSLTGAYVWSTVKANKTDPDPGLAQVTSADTITIVGSASVGGYITFPKGTTDAIAAGTYYIDCQLEESDGSLTTLDVSELTILEDVTKATAS